VASNFSIALTTPACFQVILARAALYRISLNKYASDTEKIALELAVMRHKGEALKMVRQLSSSSIAEAEAGRAQRTDDLLASIISLGTFDRRTGCKDAAGVHYSAVRRILKATGGPFAVQSVLLSRVMCFFECIYGTSPESYIWDEGDVKRLMHGLNARLARLWEFWRSLSDIHALAESSSETTAPTSATSPTLVEDDQDPQPWSSNETPLHSFCLRPGSTLLSLLVGRPLLSGEEEGEIPAPRRLELIFQVTCLLTLAMVTVDLASDFRALQRYMDGLHKQTDDLRLAGHSCNNVMWQMQVNDHSDAHGRRIWHAAGYAWVLKHASYKVQATLKDWLLGFFTAQSATVPDKPYRLDPFHFSYAS